jgi:hypothetical protein
MNIFTWLIIGHLVGDWMLQNDWMARGKARSLFTQAIFVHCAVYTLTLLAALWIATIDQQQRPPYIVFLLLIFFSHWLIDAGNLAGHWVRWWRQSRLLFVRIMVDQTLHVLVLACFMEWWL